MGKIVSGEGVETGGKEIVKLITPAQCCARGIIDNAKSLPGYVTPQ